MAARWRVLHDNLLIRSATVITASSVDSGFPVAWLRDHTPTKPWRSKLGWNIMAGWNDKLDFNRSGVKVATITAGNYATGAAMAAAIVTALEVADATPAWACAYDAGTKKFTISSDIAFTLLFGTGANITTGIGPDLGYAVADTVSAVSHLAGSVSYKSREWLRFDLGSAMAATAGVAHDHNLGASHTVKLLGKTSSNVWVSPGTTKTLDGDDLNKRILFFTVETFRYWLILFEDTTNAAGYSELGVPFAGPVFEFERGAFEAERTPEPLTMIMRAAGGAIHKVVRPAPRRYDLSFRRISRANRDAYQAIEDARPHGFFVMDAINYPGKETVYGTPGGFTTFGEQVDDLWQPGVITWAEDLG